MSHVSNSRYLIGSLVIGSNNASMVPLIPDKVVNAIQIVSRFWANMADEGSNKEVPNTHEGVSPNDPDFEVVLSKFQRKNLK